MANGLIQSGRYFDCLHRRFFEWENPSGNCLGTDRICENVFRHAELSATAIIERVHRDLLSFAVGTKQQAAGSRMI